MKRIKPIIKETSCGALVLYHKKALFIRNKKFKLWNIPKGHIERGESQIRCAIREVYEETGLKNVKVIKGFRKKMTYHNKQFNTLKTVVLFIFESRSDRVDMSLGENDRFVWYDREKAAKMVKSMNARHILLQGIEFAKAKNML